MALSIYTIFTVFINMNNSLCDSLNKTWKTTTKILLGQEIGELTEFEEWLSYYSPKPANRESSVSGKNVTLATDHYSKNAHFISSDEITEKSIDPLSINEIKDIDSLICAISEKWQYCGNRALGNSHSIESSDLVVDSSNILKSTNIQQSSNLYSCFLVRLGGKNSFGSGYSGNSEFMVRVVGSFNAHRCLEGQFLLDSSDIYFSHYIIGCTDVMF